MKNVYEKIMLYKITVERANIAYPEPGKYVSHERVFEQTCEDIPMEKLVRLLNPEETDFVGEERTKYDPATESFVKDQCHNDAKIGPHGHGQFGQCIRPL